MLDHTLSIFNLFLRLVQTIPQATLSVAAPWDDDHGQNEPFRPTPGHLRPGKKPLIIDEKVHYYEYHANNEGKSAYKRSPCPGVNALANRDFIPRSGKRISFPALAQAMRDVFNFGDDNVSF